MKNYSKILSAIMIMMVVLPFSACYFGGDTGNGTDPVTPSSTLFANKTNITDGAVCATGGVQIDMGFDINKNNILEEEEITKTEYVCNGSNGVNGTDASSHPFVVYTSPTYNETDVKNNTTISAVFNTEMDPGTLNETTFIVKDQNNILISGTVSYDGIIATFHPAQELNLNKKYTVTLSSSIKNVKGIATGYNHITYFITGKASVTYDGNNAESGAVPVDTSAYIEGQSATVKENINLIKPGLYFSGWNTMPNGTGTTYQPGDSLNIVNSNVILYAVWVDGYQVIYSGNGNTEGSVPVDSNFYAPGDSVTLLANSGNLAGALIQNGIKQRFSGWSLSSEGVLVGSTVSMITGNIVLYAKYTTDASVLRKTGPAGGIIFYDKGSYSNSWRYMEAASSDQSDGIQWSNVSNIITGISATGIGTGQTNTTSLVNLMGEGNYAAKLCNDLVIGSYSDWFLPSRDELNLIYQNLHAQGIEGFSFSGIRYWSSSESSPSNQLGYARAVWFGDGSELSTWSKTCYDRVRAVRVF